MAYECSWCGREVSQREEELDDADHSVCLDCVDELLYKMGEEAERQSWALAFEIERQCSYPPKGRVQAEPLTVQGVVHGDELGVDNLQPKPSRKTHDSSFHDFKAVVVAKHLGRMQHGEMGPPP